MVYILPWTRGIAIAAVLSAWACSAATKPLMRAVYSNGSVEASMLQLCSGVSSCFDDSAAACTECVEACGVARSSCCSHACFATATSAGGCHGRDPRSLHCWTGRCDFSQAGMEACAPGGGVPTIPQVPANNDDGQVVDWQCVQHPKHASLRNGMTVQDWCEDHNNLKDGDEYLFNEGRDDDKKQLGVCGDLGTCWCCKRPASVSCDESMSGDGADYRGCQTSTRNGRTCQTWTSQTPHGHTRTPGNAEYSGAGLGEHNYCRNPDGEPSIWCYTTDPDKRWELCNPLPV